MPYAIARIAKLKRGSLAGSASHCARQRPTPNANTSQQNIRFIGSNEPEEKLSDLVLSLINQHQQKRKIRPDAVYCVELLLTASPSYFRPEEPKRGGYWDEQRLNAWLVANRQWLTTTWGDRIVRAELHLDEMTPHIHAYLVPLNDLQQLNCKALFGGREKMRKFQDDYHAAMHPLGLERGIKGSRAQHQDIKDFYQIVNVGRDLEQRIEPEVLLAKAADRDRALVVRQEMEKTAQALALKVEQLEASNSKLNAQVNQLRDLPLDEVAWHLGLDKNKNRWKGHNHNITIDKSKFYDFSNERGGAGAIDLVMQVRQCPYQEALVWLNTRFGESGMLKAVTHHARLQAIEIAQTSPAPVFQPPQSDESQWERVRDYLLNQRKLPDYLIDALHQTGTIYADSHQNAVFLMRSVELESWGREGSWGAGGAELTKDTIPLQSLGLGANLQVGCNPDLELSPSSSSSSASSALFVERETKGAFLRGTRGKDNLFKGYADDTKRDLGWFSFQMGGSGSGQDPVSRVVILKSPIDALSFAVLDQQKQNKRTLYLVADSVRQLPLDYLNDKEVVVAYDRGGDQKAKQIKRIIAHAQRQRPKGEDWNADLQKLNGLQQPPQSKLKSQFELE